MACISDNRPLVGEHQHRDWCKGLPYEDRPYVHLHPSRLVYQVSEGNSKAVTPPRIMHDCFQVTDHSSEVRWLYS